MGVYKEGKGIVELNEKKIYSTLKRGVDLFFN